MADARNYEARIKFANGDEKTVGMTHINFTGGLEEAKALFKRGFPKDEILEIKELPPPTDQEVAAVAAAVQRYDPAPQPAAIRSIRQPGAPGQSTADVP